MYENDIKQNFKQKMLTTVVIILKAVVPYIYFENCKTNEIIM